MLSIDGTELSDETSGLEREGVIVFLGNVMFLMIFY